MVAPNEGVDLIITGGLPNTTVNGQFHGARSEQLAEVLSYIPLLSANTIGTSSVAPRQQLWPDGTALAQQIGPSFTVAANTQQNPVFTLLPNTADLRIAGVPASRVRFRYSLAVVGSQSGIQYYGDPDGVGNLVAVPTPALSNTIPVDTELDRQLIVSVFGDPSVNSSYFVSALFQPESPGAFVPTGQPWQQAVSSVTFSANFVAGTPQVEIAGVAGQVVYVHYIFIVANGVSNVSVQDTGANPIAQGSANAAGIALTWDGKGRQVTPGLGVQVSTGANVGLNGVIGYTQQ